MFCPFLNTENVVLPRVDSRCGCSSSQQPLQPGVAVWPARHRASLLQVCWDGTLHLLQREKPQCLLSSQILSSNTWVLSSEVMRFGAWEVENISILGDRGNWGRLDETVNPADLPQDSNPLQTREDATRFSKQGMSGRSCLSCFWSACFLLATPEDG